MIPPPTLNQSEYEQPADTLQINADKLHLLRLELFCCRNRFIWTQNNSHKSTFIAYATELGLDINTFENDMDRADIDDKITSHYQSGVASGVNSTPTFFLKNVKLGLIKQMGT